MDCLDKPLKPLKNFLEANFRYALFDRKYVTEDLRVINSFKLKAIKENWCVTY